MCDCETADVGALVVCAVRCGAADVGALVVCAVRCGACNDCVEIASLVACPAQHRQLVPPLSSAQQQ